MLNFITDGWHSVMELDILSTMKTTLDLPEDLLREARSLTSVKTKRGLVIRALQELVRRRRIERLFERAGRREFRLDNADLERLRHVR